MAKTKHTRAKLVAALQERAKELNCLYEVEQLLSQAERPSAETFQAVSKVIGPGWQYPDVCEAHIEVDGQSYKSAECEQSPWTLCEDICVQGDPVGKLCVCYTEERPTEDNGPFLKEEVRLIRSLAERLGQYVLFQRLRNMRRTWNAAQDGSATQQPEWQGALNLLRDTDKALYLRVNRKMLNHLCSAGVVGAQALLQAIDVDDLDPDAESATDDNIPEKRRTLNEDLLLEGKPFALAADRLSNDEILRSIRWWIQEDKIGFLIKVLGKQRSTLPEIVDALRRYSHVVTDDLAAPQSTRKSLQVSLAQRVLTEQLDFIKTAKDHLRIKDYHALVDKLVYPSHSQGKLGGKASGLLLANAIVQGADPEQKPSAAVKVPKTWYVASDGLVDFFTYNDLNDVVEQKFKEIDEIRREYPNIVQLFKNSPFPPDLSLGLSAALDDFGESPLIVRSSSLLEDRFGTAFSGKYKSLFLANQGPKNQRLAALEDAIAEIYASVFAADPIEYRREKGLLEFYEEMGILIQEVVGTRVGRYFFPAFAGVAFSRNEFRWSPRIERDDGLVRVVPGLGTRAVDRTSDDYPILIVPRKPKLQVNVAVDEVLRYAPKKIDVIDFETNSFTTLDLSELIRTHGQDYPALSQVFSVVEGDRLTKPVPLLFDPERDVVTPTFRGLRDETSFLSDLDRILRLLEESLDTPVDIEFAHDGTDFYLLQCRPQSYAADEAPAPIPRDIPDQDILFTAHSHVSNGWMPDITHLVYVDPLRYGQLGSRAELLEVGRAVGKLNKLLPKKQFVLMGPGRWGSRGDIKLGVSVTYADISNTAMLIEIARQSGGYLPDLSFGTHFFQDLVETRIRYLPLYPDDPDVVFNERYLQQTKNLLPDLLPSFAHLADTVRVVDIPAHTDDRVLQVLMNADLDEAVGVFAAPGAYTTRLAEAGTEVQHQQAEYWRWRRDMARKIAVTIDPAEMGVVAIYLFGSVKNATAGPGSDIDLLVHFRGSSEQSERLTTWLEGWSLCLAEMNYIRTGYKSDGLLDVHIVTDEDIAKRTSFAVKIGAVTDAARELPLSGLD